MQQLLLLNIVKVSMVSKNSRRIALPEHWHYKAKNEKLLNFKPQNKSTETYLALQITIYPLKSTHQKITK